MPSDPPRTSEYYAMVSRANRRPHTELYRWKLQQRMPEISIPLTKGDPDVPFDLQRAFANVFDRAHYDLSLDYTVPLDAPPSPDEEPWLREVVARAT